VFVAVALKKIIVKGNVDENIIKDLVNPQFMVGLIMNIFLETNPKQFIEKKQQ
tara:strand:- start:3151 stop:3309 length:159 start_codon:yes stop_codon:yes gene_type:complete